MTMAAVLLALSIAVDDSALQGCAWSELWEPLRKESEELLRGRPAESQIPPRQTKARFTAPRPAPGASYTLDGPWLVEIVVSPKGQVVDAKVVREPADPPWPEYAKALRDAVRRWKFKPSTVDGRPVGACVAVPVIQK